MSQNVKTVALAADHAGYELKGHIAAHLSAAGFKVLDLGTDSDARVDYPDYGYKLAEAIAAGTAQRGIAVCGSGVGIGIAANRYKVVRAALCVNAEMAQLARQHNDANVLAMGARLIDVETALSCVDTFLSEDFEGGRHEGRVNKLGNKGV
ncbi:MAG: ribose 5-phosphate isomerase B [Alphaproteobacteria bacterium]|nr:ribose 5-phosphate isomerase B [Alphaproteobacteria bacterium]